VLVVPEFVSILVSCGERDVNMICCDVYFLSPIEEVLPVELGTVVSEEEIDISLIAPLKHRW